MFEYILEKINNEKIIEKPYKHLEIKDLLKEEHLSNLLQDKQLHFDECENDLELFQNLIQKQYTPFAGAGVTTNLNEYLEMVKDKKGILGMGFRLDKPENPILINLLNFFRSDKFHNCLKSKFNLSRPTRLHTDIRKYLSRYQISPHPDMREKAMTYLLNINKPGAELLDIHTKIMSFKKEYEWKYEEWEKNPNTQREWVPWDWCKEEKSINENNSIVIFSPNDRTLHAAKIYYDHYKLQRTQLYGNLWYTGS